MRITHVITRLIVGGAQENTVSSVLGLARKPGYQVDLISGPTTGREGSLEPLFTPTEPAKLRILPSLVRPIHPWLDLQALRSLTRDFRRHRPEVVHTHSGKAGVLGRVAAKKAGVPIVIHTVHGPSFGTFQGPLKNWIFRSAEKWAARHTDHFVSVAQAMTDQYIAEGIGCAKDYTRVFSGFDLEPFLQAARDPALRSQLGLPEDAFVIGKLARLAPLKGHEDLLAAAPSIIEQIPHARFLFIGDGPLWEPLKESARRLNIERHVVFAGLIPPSSVGAYLAQLDVLVHLSRREGLPRALPQALAAGKPVVAFDIDGAREICIENQTGFLLKAGDIAALSKRLVQLARQPDLRATMGERGRKMVLECFAVQRMVDRLAELYERLKSQASPAAAC